MSSYQSIYLDFWSWIPHLMLRNPKLRYGLIFLRVPSDWLFVKYKIIVFEFIKHFGYSREYVVFPSIIGTCHIILVKLPTSSTCQSVTACILSMPKLVTFKAPQRVWNIWYYRYMQITCLHRIRKGRDIKCQNKGVFRNKFIVPAYLYPLDACE